MVASSATFWPCRISKGRPPRKGSNSSRFSITQRQAPSIRARTSRSRPEDSCAARAEKEAAPPGRLGRGEDVEVSKWAVRPISMLMTCRSPGFRSADESLIPGEVREFLDLPLDAVAEERVTAAVDVVGVADQIFG